MKTNLKDVRIVNNFYQSSSFFPMPTVIASTLCEDGTTSLGSYSLVFPYYVAERDYFACILMSRNSSNTAKNILKTGKVALNFIPDKRKYLKEAVRLGFPGDTPQEKMKDCIFTLTEGIAKNDDKAKRPLIIEESFQVFECTWDDTLDNKHNKEVKEEYAEPFNNFNGITSPNGSHFILKIDNILLKDKFKKQIIDGVKAGSFPKVPVDYGYRDNKNFWLTKFVRPFALKIQAKGMRVESVMYAADRIDPDVKFTKEACETIVKVPRVFLNTVLKACVAWAKENNVKLITPEHMQIIRDKRNKEK